MSPDAPIPLSLTPKQATALTGLLSVNKVRLMLMGSGLTAEEIADIQTQLKAVPSPAPQPGLYDARALFANASRAHREQQAQKEAAL